MKIEFKSIKVHAGLSEETAAYTAKVYVDGKHVLNVRNSGHGGCDDYDNAPNRTGNPYDLVKEIDAWIEANSDEEFDSLEVRGQTAAFDEIDLKNFLSKLSRKVLIVRDGNVYELKGKKSAGLIALATEKYGAENVLNNMSAREAFKFLAA